MAAAPVPRNSTDAISLDYAGTLFRAPDLAGGPHLIRSKAQLVSLVAGRDQNSPLRAGVAVINGNGCAWSSPKTQHLSLREFWEQGNREPLLLLPSNIVLLRDTTKAGKMVFAHLQVGGRTRDQKNVTIVKAICDAFAENRHAPVVDHEQLLDRYDIHLHTLETSELHKDAVRLKINTKTNTSNFAKVVYDHLERTIPQEDQRQYAIPVLTLVPKDPVTMGRSYQDEDENEPMMKLKQCCQRYPKVAFAGAITVVGIVVFFNMWDQCLDAVEFAQRVIG